MTPCRHRSRLRSFAEVGLSLGVALFFPALAAAQSAASAPAGVTLGAHWRTSTASTFTGLLDFYRGTTSRSTYAERFGTGNGAGASIAYEFSPFVEIALAVDRSTHRGVREDSTIAQRSLTGESTVRLLVPRLVPHVVPYVSASAITGKVDETSGPFPSGSPWPGTQHLYGRGTFVGGGLRVPVSTGFALDAEVKHGRFLFDRVDVVASTHGFDDPKVGRSSRVSVGAVWHPWPEPALDGSPTAVTENGTLRLEGGQPVRFHLDDGTALVGDVVETRGDSVQLQVRSLGRLSQRTIATTCIDAVDVRRGTRARTRNVFESAVQGTVLFSLLRFKGDFAPPMVANEYVRSGLEGAALGTLFGLFRDQDRWQRATPESWRRRAGRARCDERNSPSR